MNNKLPNGIKLNILNLYRSKLSHDTSTYTWNFGNYNINKKNLFKKIIDRHVYKIMPCGNNWNAVTLIIL